MKILGKLLIVSSIATTVLSANASDIYQKIAEMKKGTDGYIIGQILTKSQQDKSNNTMIKSNDPKVINFLDGKDLLISINANNKKVIVINKRYNQITQENVKGIIGNMIHDFDEPTVMAHDKLIYWVFDKNGDKLAEDDLKAWKDKISGKQAAGKSLAEVVNEKKKEINFNPYIKIKLTSDQPIMTKTEKPMLANASIIISSDKLIKETTGMK